jgi:hypothetical protein
MFFALYLVHLLNANYACVEAFTVISSVQCKNNDSCKKLSGNNLDQLQIFAHMKHFLVVIKVILK